MQLVTEDRVDAARRGGDVTWLTPDDMAAHVRRLRKDETAWLPTTGAGSA